MVDIALTFLIVLLMVIGVPLTVMMLVNILIRGIIDSVDAYYDLRETIKFRKEKANENDE